MDFQGLPVWVKEESHFLAIKIIIAQALMGDTKLVKFCQTGLHILNPKGKMTKTCMFWQWEGGPLGRLFLNKNLQDQISLLDIEENVLFLWPNVFVQLFKTQFIDIKITGFLIVAADNGHMVHCI